MGSKTDAGVLYEYQRRVAQQALQAQQVKFEFGELTVYDATTHRAKFTLPLVQDENDVIQETGFIPIGSAFTGAAAGVQFPPAQGAQAVVVFMDHEGFNPVCAMFLFNDIETPPFPDGKTWGWNDPTSNQIKTTQDGENSGDGEGGARIVGAGYGSFVAPKLELGMEGLDATHGVVRMKDLQAVVDFINMFVSSFNSHMHSGVQSGGSTTAMPLTMQASSPAAEASATVNAND